MKPDKTATTGAWLSSFHYNMPDYKYEEETKAMSTRKETKKDHLWNALMTLCQDFGAGPLKFRVALKREVFDESLDTVLKINGTWKKLGVEKTLDIGFHYTDRNEKSLQTNGLVSRGKQASTGVRPAYMEVYLETESTRATICLLFNSMALWES